MHENVGHLDRALRAALGGALIMVGLTALGALEGRIPGLVAVIAGVLSIESAITRVCPTNYAVGISTQELEDKLVAERAGFSEALSAARM